MKSAHSSPNDSKGTNAFSLIELCTTTALLLVGLMLASIAVSHAGVNSWNAICLQNKKKLMEALFLYATDSAGLLPAAYQGGMAQNPTKNDPHGPWIYGWLDWGNRKDNTNTLLLIDPGYSSTARYMGNDPRVFKCPADKYLSPAQRALGWKERVRSVSLDAWLGYGNVESGPADAAYYKHIFNIADLTFPSPADCFSYLDEHPESINDPSLFPPTSDKAYTDTPANYHEGGFAVAFMDGHALIHYPVMAASRNYPVRYLYGSPVLPPNDPDVHWLRTHAPRKAP